MKTKIGFFGNFSIFTISSWLIVFGLLPFLLVFIASFLTRGDEEFILYIFSFESYIKIFDPLYLDVFLISFKLSIISTILCLILAFPFAYFLSQVSKKYTSALLVLTIIPFWTSSLVRTYALVVILKTKGVLNAALMGIGLINEPLEIIYTDVAVIIGMVYTLLPFMILPLYASFEKFDKRLIEAAHDLGANKTSVMLRIIIPLVSPGIIAGISLVFLPSLGMFFISDLLGGANNLVIGNFIKNQFLTFRDWPFGSVASVLLTLLMLGLIWLYSLADKLTKKRNSELF
ncbi:MAG: spermidine/putrescine ABC transporter permease PotB [Sulfuricurvum sp.]|uniref:spermidine/putrescine ABC transporter permease PotB n=1 Tax=Sulfuricurvum sp. TaxID=2025608 RepID=UPI0026158B58|nr:spermidine/putrescine ABC transporter permease PotB [Sulfuricurvum sp.]MDD2830224.1 spermidine/putrescine ABC transporter permease PotB [Sulfuricurvum sp.]MDD4950006.1 spermidine/putrescine ABC transporter permease PotB [Sulfuricurvum sp.]